MAGAEEDAPLTLSGVSSRSLRPPLRSAARLQHATASAVRGKCSGGYVGSESKVRAVRSGRGLPQPAGGSIVKAEATCCTSSLSAPRLSAAPAAVQPTAPLKPVLSGPHPVEHSTSVPLPLHPTAPPKATPPSPVPTVTILTTTSSPNSKLLPVSYNNIPPRVSAETHGSKVQCADKNMNASMLPSTEMPCILSGIPNHVLKEGSVGDEEEEEAEDVDGEEEDGEGEDKTGKRRATRYDSADSSDSGVGGEWSASSPCSSLTDSPPPEDLDDCCPGLGTLTGPRPALPHTPTAGAPLTTPPPPAARHDAQVTCMAPNDGSGVQVGRKGGHEGDQLMGRFGPGGQVGHTPHKDRPPDVDALPVRTTRRTAPHEAAHRRRRLPDHVRKRPGEEASMGGERRTKLPKASSPPSPVNGVAHINGCVNSVVNGDASDLLQRRLSGLTGTGAGEKRPRPNNHTHHHHRNNGLTKDALQNGVEHLLGKNGLNCCTGLVNSRVNGVGRPERVNGSRPRRMSGEEHRRKADHHTNNNTEPPVSLPHSPARRTPADTLPQTRAHSHAPTVGKRTTQGSPHPSQGLTLSCDVGHKSPTPSPWAAHQPPLSPTSARCSAKSSPPPAHTIPASSKSRSSSSSSGVGSSAPSSGASTPTPPCSVTVRFPPPEKKEASDVCRWRDCNVTLDPAISLLEHIQAVHVEGQLEAESFRCLWVGCKVYEKASCSVSWLERHVLTHGGHKPFKCIVEGCGQRFTSQMALGRHVNHHFSTAAATPAPRPPTQPSPTKLIRKNGRKCRYRKKPWSDSRAKPPVPARMFDMFDVGVMERLQWRLMCATQVQNGGTPLTSAQTFTLRPQVLARRICGQDSAEVLVKWSPPGILADEWIPTDQLEPVRQVPLEQLSPEAKQVVSQLYYPPTTWPRKHKRKSSSCPKSLSLELTKAV